MERALRRGHHERPVHRLRRLRRHLPARRDRLRARGGQVHPVPPRRGARPRQLRPRVRRRRRLHHLHPRLPAIPCVGAGRRHAPVRPRPRARRDGRHLASAVPHPCHRQDRPRERSGRWPRLRVADLVARERLHRCRARVGRRRRRRVEGQARRRRDEGGDPRDRRVPLHVLREPAGTARSPRARLRAARPRRHGLPDVVTAGHVGPQGRQGVQAVPVQHRSAVFQDVRRLDLRGALRGQVRPEEAGHGQDEHQGRVPDLDEGRRATTRST